MGDMQKLKKLKITLTGSSESLQVNDIGSPYLHFRKQVAITRVGKSKVGRAIVFDQHIIDKSFLEQKLTAEQHNVCNKYLELIAKSGALGKALGLGKEIFTSHSFSKPPPRSVILSKVQKKLVNDCGHEKEKIFWRIMVKNPTEICETKELVMQQCSNALLTYWYISQKNPVSLFQQSLVSQA
jgi:hypothetical protein